MTVYFSGGSRGAGDPRPPLFFDQKEAQRAEKIFSGGRPPPPLFSGSGCPPPPPSPPSLPIPSTVQCRIIFRETLSQTHKLSEVFQKKLHGQQVERTIITILTQQRLEVVLL